MRFQLYFATMAMLVGCGDSGTGGAGGTGSGGESAGGEAAGGEAAGGEAAGGSAPAEGCAGLCTQSGFDDGTEMDFGNGLVECSCDGTGGEIMKADCEAYCADFGVDAADSLLSMTNVPNDKCVCDGT